jgi:hypothetical protein
MKKPVWMLALVLACGLVAAGCGSDDDSGDSGDTAGEALTQEEFVTQGNAICAAGNKEIDAGASGLGDQPTEEQLNAFVGDTLVPSVTGQIDDIRALEPPEDISAQVTTFLDDAETALGELEADPSLLTSGDPFADVNTQATAIGLTECAS